MLSTKVDVVSESVSDGVGTIKVTGYLRGTPVNVNQLIHLTDIGTFQMDKICSEQDINRYF